MALYELSVAFSAGRGVARDLVEAFKWMDLAVYRARGLLRQKYTAERDVMAKKMTSEQVAAAEAMEVQWKKKWAP